MATIDPGDDVGIADGETIFNGLLLAVIGRRRLLVLVGDAPATRVGLLARLARHVEAEGCMVMTVAAATGVTVEDLLEVAGSSMLGPDCTPASFEELVDALEERLDLAGTGVLMIEESDRLSPDTLRDLVDLSASVSPSGRFLQILLSGGPEMISKLETADLLPTVEAVGTIYTVGPTVAPERGGTSRSAPENPVFAAPSIPRREKPSRKGGWVAALMIGVLALAGGAYLYDAGVLEDPRVAGLLGLEQPGERRTDPGDEIQRPRPETAAPDLFNRQFADERAAPETAPGTGQPVTRDPAAGPSQVPTRPTAPSVVPAPTQTPEADADVAGTNEDEQTRYSADDVERFSQLAGRVLSGTEEPAAVDPLQEIPPAEESQPLAAEELAEIEAATEQELAEEQATDEPPAEEAATAAGDDSVALAPPPGPTQAELRELRNLAQRTEAQFAARKLTTPPQDNAFATMQDIQAIDPDHPLLPVMRARILETYQAWANTAEARQDFQTARTYYQRALRVDPANPQITAKLDAANDRLAGRVRAPRVQEPANAPPEPRLR